MDAWLAIRLAHIIGATLLFGTGLGTAFFMWRADRSGDVAAIAVTARNVVLADWLFTAPAIVAQPITGYLLVLESGYRLTEGWLLLSLGLYAVAGVCWLPVVWLQARMRDLSLAARDGGTELPPEYHRCMRIWFALGWPAFAAVAAIFALMVYRPVL
ncbi:MAG: DUF2269 domain-containing protein [Alphaproteobacteria bacterium]